jgi:predicted peptidase
MKSFILAVASLGLLSSIVPASRADEQHGFQLKTHKFGDEERKYTLFVPPSYKGDSEFPLILFLHGAGERGDDGAKCAKIGLGTGIRKYKGGEKEFPFFAIFPQCKQGENWSANGKAARNALEILAEVQKEYKIDANRIYLTGLSLGGFGTWSLAAAYPEKWAAIVPICGGGDPKNAEKIKNLPCWCFHGDADKSVNVQRSRDMIEALKKAGSEPKYTEYPGVGHNSWDKAYGTAELYKWLLEQKKL